MQSRYLCVALAVGFLPALCLSPVAEARHGHACGGGFYGGPVYYAPRSSVYYAPPAHYAAPMYGHPYSSAPMYGQSYSPAPMYGQSRSALPAQARPTTTINVVMYDDNFQPKTINVQPGTTVRWTNNGTHTHTITAKNNSWDSGDIRPGATYSATFQQPGAYYYYCRHHPGMEGTIVVGQGAASRGGTNGYTRGTNGYAGETNGYARPRSAGY